MRKWLFFFFFHEAGEGVGMERMLCWWLAELLLVVGGASVCDWWSFCWRKNKRCGIMLQMLMEIFLPGIAGKLQRGVNFFLSFGEM